MYDRENTCCFTGHRPAKLPWGSRESDPRCTELKLELAAPTLSQARTLVRAYEKQADAVYQQLLCQLLDEKESGHAEL